MFSNELWHEGVKYKSGRYPHGSGERPHQHDNHLSADVASLQKQGISETEIAKAMGMSTTQLRARLTAEKEFEKQQTYYRIIALKEKGYSWNAIAENLGLKNESTARSIVSSYENRKKVTVDTVADILRDSIKNSPNGVDVGEGVETYVGVSQVRLNSAVQKLRDEGYSYHVFKVKQAGTGEYTTVKALYPPDTEWSAAYQSRDKLVLPNGWLIDGNAEVQKRTPPVNLDSGRVFIRYGDQGGSEKDGVIEIRPGVSDLQLGGDRYAQVRIAVDGSHFLKGMAIYSDSIPNGYDVVFNTNKATGTDKYKVFKPLEDDPERPFKTDAKPLWYTDANGELKQSVINKVKGEGDVDNWRKVLASQFLAKQSPELAKRQLKLAYDVREQELEEIMKITNPAVKKQALLDLANHCDSDAVDLNGYRMPRQSTKYILPVRSLKDTEVYAPDYKDGEEVILVRYPHAGTFEIPRLIVNNKNPEAKKSLGNAKDAVGINSHVAEKLSGADFDGDTVLVIPTKGQKLATSPSLKELENFNAKETYHNPKLPEMSDREKGFQMGIVSNLITDMNVKGASDPSEYARAVKHSMVVIDAQKHKLDYKQSEIDNRIDELKRKYQSGGASTLLSRTKSPERVGIRKERIDPNTGEKVYTYTGETYVNKEGKTVLRTKESTKMYETNDAYTLSSGTRIESIYADHANSLKALANRARKEAVNVKSTPYSPSARETYKAEVASLDSKLVEAKKNKPLERIAQSIASKEVASIIKANPNMGKEAIQKARNRAIASARVKTGASKHSIYITDNEWKAIQSGAVSTTKLTSILSNADRKRVLELSRPRTNKSLASSTIERIKRMEKAGMNSAQIAEGLGLSVEMVKKYV